MSRLARYSNASSNSCPAKSHTRGRGKAGRLLIERGKRLSLKVLHGNVKLTSLLTRVEYLANVGMFQASAHTCFAQ